MIKLSFPWIVVLVLASAGPAFGQDQPDNPFLQNQQKEKPKPKPTLQELAEQSKIDLENAQKRAAETEKRAAETGRRRAEAEKRAAETGRRRAEAEKRADEAKRRADEAIDRMCALLNAVDILHAGVAARENGTSPTKTPVWSIQKKQDCRTMTLEEFENAYSPK